MHSAAILSAIFAVAALGHVIRRDVVTRTEVDVVTTVVMVAASSGAPAPTAPAPPVRKYHRHHKHKNSVAFEDPATSSAPPAPYNSPQPEHHHHSQPDPVPQSATSYNGVAVEQHNLHRTNHSAPGVQWDDDLAQSAAALAAGCVFEHNVELGPASSYGQNIASSSPASGSTADELKQVITDMWYNGEVASFDGLYGQASPDMTNFDSWGHFTQVVWKSTQKIGCHTQNCPNMGYFTVCNYLPAGNMMGEFAQNVRSSQGEASVQA